MHTGLVALGRVLPVTMITAAQRDAQGNILVQCDAVALATRYRCRMLLVGVETDYRVVASGTEPKLSVAGVVPGQTAQFIVQAEVAKPAAAPEPVAVKAPTNGNGHSNGHGRTLHARAA